MENSQLITAWIFFNIYFQKYDDLVYHVSWFKENEIVVAQKRKEKKEKKVGIDGKDRKGWSAVISCDFKKIWRATHRCNRQGQAGSS